VGETMMSGFTMNYLNLLRMHASNHVTPMDAVCDQPLLSECASYIHEQFKDRVWRNMQMTCSNICICAFHTVTSLSSLLLGHNVSLLLVLSPTFFQTDGLLVLTKTFSLLLM